MQCQKESITTQNTWSTHIYTFFFTPMATIQNISLYKFQALHSASTYVRSDYLWIIIMRCMTMQWTLQRQIKFGSLFFTVWFRCCWCGSLIRWIIRTCKLWYVQMPWYFYIYRYKHNTTESRSVLMCKHRCYILTDSRQFTYIREHGHFMWVWRIFLYELNTIAPTWLPKTHSPTAIKAAKSGFYSHHIIFYVNVVQFFLFYFMCVCVFVQENGQHYIKRGRFFFISHSVFTHPVIALHRFCRWIIFLSKQTVQCIEFGLVRFGLAWFGWYDTKKEKN